MSFSSDEPLVSNQLRLSVDFPEVSTPEFIPILDDMYKRIADAVNTKEGALYIPIEDATFQLYFSADPQRLRNVYRKTIDFGALPNTATKSVPHGIAFTTEFTTTRIYGSATDPVNLSYLPLPYASPTPANNIELNVDGTNVNITTGSDRTLYTRTTVVIEYLKNL